MKPALASLKAWGDSECPPFPELQAATLAATQRRQPPKQDANSEGSRAQKEKKAKSQGRC